jgi:hypothetical protein
MNIKSVVGIAGISPCSSQPNFPKTIHTFQNHCVMQHISHKRHMIKTASGNVSKQALLPVKAVPRLRQLGSGISIAGQIMWDV